MNEGINTILNHSYDDLDIKILDAIYNDNISVMRLIIKRLSYMAHRVTVSKRIQKMERWGLIKKVEKTNPLCLNKDEIHNGFIIKMIDEYKRKWRLR